MKAPEILTRAAQHMADRAATYDKPEGERSMGKTVAAFNAITGRDLTESEGWLLMTLLKFVRDSQRPEPHQDSIEDAVAYSALYGESRLAGKSGDSSGDGWIAWNGGICPTHLRESVAYITKGGNVGSGIAGSLEWRHHGIRTDIAFYRAIA